MSEASGIGFRRGGVGLWRLVQIGGKARLLQAILNPEARRNLVAAVEHQIGHHVRDLRGHAEADLEAAVGDELAGAAGQDRLRTVALPTLRRLRDETGESAQVYRRRGDARLCVAAVEPRTGLRDTVPEGATLTMQAGSAAQVLAAWSDADFGFSERLLATVRRRGWAESVAEREAGVGSVSAPVFTGERVVAAVSISGPLDRLTRQPGKRFGEAVVGAAETIQADLGRYG